jgi:hypothetical protein
MKRHILLILILAAAGEGFTQTHTLNGSLKDSTNQPVAYATVALLKPSDSTMLFYAISATDGSFIIKGITADTFLMQVASMDYHTYYKPVVISRETNTQNTILRNKTHLLDEVSVKGEKIPLLLRGDTVEYNAGAYKTKPDAVVEDLLKKLPGVEVDRAGNIKAQGKQVNKVLVDGKEFFGDDPKVATKNLPAGAINKVQVFDKKSDAGLFTGIDDGERDKTINLELKENKRSGYFGNVVAGGGNDERFKVSGRVYRFRKKSQLALLGMANNINEFGFTLDDYLNFQGGMRSLMDGNGNFRFNMNSNDNLPIDFGQPVNGLITSAAAGFNYTYEPKDNQRFNISYLGNGANKQLDESSYSRNYTFSGEFERNEESGEYSEDRAHRFNISGRSNIDSSLMLSAGGGISLLENNLNSRLLSSSFIKSAVLNNLDSKTDETGNGISATGRLSLIKKLNKRYPALKFGVNADYRQSFNKSEWENLYMITGNGTSHSWQFQDNDTRTYNYSASSSIVRSLKGGFFVEPKITAGTSVDELKRNQGNKTGGDIIIDSLSPDFSRTYSFIRPGISLQQSTKKRMFRASIQYEAGKLNSEMYSLEPNSADYNFILPSLMWRKEFGMRSNIEFGYATSINTPMAQQMVPAWNSSNPIMQLRGNQFLKPEYQHQASLHFLRFDEFTFSSIFLNLSGRYITDKINYTRDIQQDLTQSVSFVNVPEDYVLNARAEYSSPIRRLGITYTAAVTERYQKGINIIDGSSNNTTTFDHELEFKISNRKKDKWDIQVGGLVNYTDSKYSIQKELDNYFYNIGYFTELNYRPGDKWNFNLVADIHDYYSRSFKETVTIPLVKADVSYFFLKYNRGSLTLNAFDILNSNNGLERISELNYLLEKRSNIIGQYFMLSFKYRISKAGNKEGMNVIQIGK